MVAYSIFVNILVFFLIFFCFVMEKQKREQAGLLIWSDRLKAGRYKVVAKSDCGTFAILWSDNGYEYIGVKTSCGELPDVGKTFQWKVKKLKGHEGKAVLEKEGLLPPE